MNTPRFIPDFKEQADRQITERGYSVTEVSDRLGIFAHSLYKWLRSIKPDNGEQHARN
jgi:transposase-like protein